MSEEVGVEVRFLKRFNLGNFNHKEYELKLTGKQSQIEEQLSGEQQRLAGYISQLEEIVSIADDANKLKARLVASAPASAPAVATSPPSPASAPSVVTGTGKMEEL